jgi:hypothetical protein
MKANELMIDNLLNKHWFNEGGTYDTPTKVSGNDLKYWDKCGVQKDYTPIPLTEELLIEFGFVKVQDSGFEHWELNGFCVDCLSLGRLFIKVGGKPRQLQYVHTLQNAFALTGEELTIRNNRL